MFEDLEYEPNWTPMPNKPGWYYDSNVATPENPGILRSGVPMEVWLNLFLGQPTSG